MLVGRFCNEDAPLIISTHQRASQSVSATLGSALWVERKLDRPDYWRLGTPAARWGIEARARASIGLAPWVGRRGESKHEGGTGCNRMNFRSRLGI